MGLFDRSKRRGILLAGLALTGFVVALTFGGPTAGSSEELPPSSTAATAAQPSTDSLSESAGTPGAAPAATATPTAALTATVTGTPARPVIVELFTSQGCSSCPAADRILADLGRNQPVAGARVIPVVHHVDYWDSPEWKDPFSTEQATLRQYSYAAHEDTSRIYTPQLIVDGGAPIVGNRRTDALRAIHAAAEKPIAVKVEIDWERFEVRVGAPPEGSRMFLTLALTEDGLGGDEIPAGENQGLVLRHDGVVRWSLELGPLDAGIGAAIQPNLPEEFSDPNRRLNLVAFVQEQGPGSIVGAAVSSVPASRR